MSQISNTMEIDHVDSMNDDNNAPSDIHGYLIGIDENGNHSTLHSLIKPITRIGASKDNDIVLNHRTVSLNHAQIEIDINLHRALIVNLQSTHKTRIGSILPSSQHQNEIIEPNRECIINSGDYISFGGNPLFILFLILFVTQYIY